MPSKNVKATKSTKPAPKKVKSSSSSTSGKKAVAKVVKAKAKAVVKTPVKRAAKSSSSSIVRPTRNRTSYMMFVKDVRKTTQTENPDMSFVDITREVAKQWGLLTDAQKKPYEARAAADKKRYTKEVIAFRAKYPDEPLTVKKVKKQPKIEGPTRARSAYVFYTIAMRPELKAKNPEMEFGDLTKEVAAGWNVLATPQKRKYEKLAEADKGRYETEATAFNDAHPEIARRKKRAKRGAPKKARSAYLYYTMEQRPIVGAKNPDMPFGDLTKLVAADWAKLSDASKRKYEKLADADKVRYEKAMETYTPPTNEELDALEENSKKKKKNGPKHPRTAYVYFTMEQRPGVQQENAEMKFGEITKLLAADWNVLSEGDRAKYTQQAEADKLRYQNEVAAAAAE